jgi:sugar phosphate permease
MEARGNGSAERSSFFYGWVIVFVGVVAMILIYGIRHSFAVFFSPILDEFGWSRGNISIMLSLNIFFYGLLAPFAGILVERWRFRVVMPLGIMILGLATAGCSWAKGLGDFYFLFGFLMPLGSAFSGWPIIAPALMNWFVKRRGLVMGIGQMGGGLSFVFSIPVEFAILQYGWRNAFLFLAASLVLLLLPLYLFVFYYRPQDKGLAPYGGNLDGANEDTPLRKIIPENPSAKGLTLRQILHTSQLWAFVLSYALYWGIGGYLILAHQVRFTKDAGYTSMFSVSIFALFGTTLFLGQLSGFLSDRIGREKAGTLAAALSIIALLALVAVRNNNQPWLLYVYSVCFGFGGGLFTPTIFAGAADVFPGRHFGAVAGLLLTGMGAGAALGPWLGGYIYDTTGSYVPAFFLCMICIALSCLIFWIAAPRKHFHPGR